MNHEELAFVNQQLAGMLKCGIPLEGGLKQLCSTMRRGKLRAELEALEADLAKGTPLKDALAARKLPDFYKHMLVVGAQANDLPGVLTMLADHYSKTHLLTTRLKGLAVYPLFVLMAAIVLSGLVAGISSYLLKQMLEDPLSGSQQMTLMASLWTPPLLVSLLLILVMMVLVRPELRNHMSWKLPGFKDANISRLAGSLSLLLKGGVPLPAALQTVWFLFANTSVSRDIALWRARVVAGNSQTVDLPTAMVVLPPLFFWLVASENEDLTKGLERAAEIYDARAQYRFDLLLYAALPVMIGMLGIMIASQLVGFLRFASASAYYLN